jgi:hypothetical protein
VVSVWGVDMKCAYCKNKATNYDALGLPACKDHLGEADEYVKKYATNKTIVEDLIPDEWYIDDEYDPTISNKRVINEEYDWG